MILLGCEGRIQVFLNIKIYTCLKKLIHIVIKPENIIVCFLNIMIIFYINVSLIYLSQHNIFNWNNCLCLKNYDY
jgi:hypothetical protein